MAAEKLPVQLACRVLGVSESGYYAWRDRPLSARAVRHAWLTDEIRRIHNESRDTYGALRVHAELTLGREVVVGHCAVAMLMARAGIAGLSGRPRYRRIPHVATASDLVKRDFSRDESDSLWVTDITEHPTREGKLYCAVVLDACSRKVVGWAIDSNQETSLVINALGMAIQNREPNEQTVIHSDRERNSPLGLSLNVSLMRGSCLQWAQSVIATTSRRWNRSGAESKWNSSTASAGTLVWNSPPRSSNTSKSSKFPSAATRRLACLHPSSLKLDVDQRQPLEIKQSDSTKPRAPQSLQETQGGSLSVPGIPDSTLLGLDYLPIVR
jgi:Integrase core domain/HTH-like domain